MGKWEMVRLGDVCGLVNGYAFDSKHFSASSKNMPIIRIRDVVRGYTETYTCESFHENLVVTKGDLLIGMDGEFNIAPWKSADALLNQRVCKIFSKTEFLLERFLLYFLPKALKDIEATTPFVTVKHLSSRTINNIEIPLPSLEIQRKIADVLDRAAALIEKRKAQIEKLDLLVKSQFIEMFGDPVTNTLKWEKRSLVEYIIFLTSGSRGWSSYFSNDGSIFLTIKNVKNSKIVLDNIQYVTPPKTKEATRTKVKVNDLLISITADLGRTAIVPKFIASYGAYINQHLSLVRLDATRIHPLYVSYYLESNGGKLQFSAKDQVGVKSGLNFDSIKSLAIQVPPLEMQCKFSAFVNQLESRKSTVQQSLNKLHLYYASLMQKCFRGEIF